MLEYNRLDISEGIDVNKANASKNVIFVIIGILKILIVGTNHILATAVMIYCKKLWILMVLLLFMLMEVPTEFFFDISAKMMQLTL